MRFPPPYTILVNWTKRVILWCQFKRIMIKQKSEGHKFTRIIETTWKIYVWLEDFICV